MFDGIIPMDEEATATAMAEYSGNANPPELSAASGEATVLFYSSVASNQGPGFEFVFGQSEFSETPTSFGIGISSFNFVMPGFIFWKFVLPCA